MRELIDHYVGAPSGFERAWEKFYRVFGRLLIVANCCEERLSSFPKIKPRDSENLQKYANLMSKALVQLEGIDSFTSLNSLGTLRRMVDKLPDKLQEDWLKLSFSITEEARREVVFRDLAQFVNRQAEMSASVFGKSSWERFDKSRQTR